MSRADGQPYITKACYASVCPETGRAIRKGAEIAYFPRTRTAYHKASPTAERVRDALALGVSSVPLSRGATD